MPSGSPTGTTLGSALAYVAEALDLWRGDPYQEFADEEWAAAEATRLEATFTGSGHRVSVCQCLVSLDRAERGHLRTSKHSSPNTRTENDPASC